MGRRFRDPDGVEWEMVTNAPLPGLPRAQSESVLGGEPTSKAKAVQNPRGGRMSAFNKLRKLRGSHDLRKRAAGISTTQATGSGTGASTGLPREGSTATLMSRISEDDEDKKGKLPILSFPSKVRAQTWAKVLVVEGGIYVCRCRSCLANPPFAQPALTRVSHQLRDETLPIFYGENAFQIEEVHCGNQPPLWLRTLRPAIREFFTHVRLATVEPDIAIAVEIMQMYGMVLMEAWPKDKEDTTTWLVFSGPSSCDNKSRETRQLPMKKDALEVLDMAEEVLQEQEEEYSEPRSSEDLGASDDETVYSPWTAKIAEMDREIETLGGELFQDPDFVEALRSLDNQNVEERKPSKRPVEFLDDKYNRRRMMVLNGNLTDEQMTAQVEVQAAMEQFRESTVAADEKDDAKEEDEKFDAEEEDDTDGEKDDAKEEDDTDGEDDANSVKSISALSVLENFYAPNYARQPAIPEKKREERKKSMLKEMSMPNLHAPRRVGDLISPPEGYPSYPRRRAEEWRPRPMSRLIKRMSMSATDVSTMSKSSRSRTTSQEQNIDGEGKPGVKKLGRSFSNAGWGAYKMFTLGLG